MWMPQQLHDLDFTEDLLQIILIQLLLVDYFDCYLQIE